MLTKKYLYVSSNYKYYTKDGKVISVDQQPEVGSFLGTSDWTHTPVFYLVTKVDNHNRSIEISEVKSKSYIPANVNGRS
jgi:hypothetical protein